MFSSGVYVNFIIILIIIGLPYKSDCYSHNVSDDDEFQNVLVNWINDNNTSTQSKFSAFPNDNQIDMKRFKIGATSEDMHLNIEQLIRKYGYQVEKYEVVTEDGYVLTLFRIPSSGPPIFLMHGLLLSADDWVVPGLQTGIAYLLAAEGFDVWLGNARGNKHSKRHIHQSPNSSAFWDFSWDEIGRYDLPAMIDFILLVTAETKLIYVGHSQGTTTFYVMGSERPEYDKKVSLMIALAPVAAVPHLRSPVLKFFNYIAFFHPDLLFVLVRKMGLNEFFADSDFERRFAGVVCGNSESAKLICSNVVFLLCGFSYSQLNVTNLPVFFAHTPAGASFKQIEHYIQTFTSKRFQKFDYGKEKNQVLYGSSIPPEYNVERITTPMAMFYSENDWLAAVPDVLILRSKLKNITDFYKVPDSSFNHIDFVYGLDVKNLIFPRLLKLVRDSSVK